MVLVVAWLFRPALRHSMSWTATATPLASRAFAFYYFLQCLVGLVASTSADRLKNGPLWRACLALMALALLLVVLFATPDP